MESGFEFIWISETPSVEMVEHTGVFGGVIWVFVEKGVSGGVDGVRDAECSGDTLAKLGFADAKISLEGKNEGIFARKIEMLARN